MKEIENNTDKIKKIKLKIKIPKKENELNIEKTNENLKNDINIFFGVSPRQDIARSTGKRLCINKNKIRDGYPIGINMRPLSQRYLAVFKENDVNIYNIIFLLPCKNKDLYYIVDGNHTFDYGCWKGKLEFECEILEGDASRHDDRRKAFNLSVLRNYKQMGSCYANKIDAYGKAKEYHDKYVKSNNWEKWIFLNRNPYHAGHRSVYDYIRYYDKFNENKSNERTILDELIEYRTSRSDIIKFDKGEISMEEIKDKDYKNNIGNDIKKENRKILKRITGKQRLLYIFNDIINLYEMFDDKEHRDELMKLYNVFNIQLLNKLNDSKECKKDNVKLEVR